MKKIFFLIMAAFVINEASGETLKKAYSLYNAHRFLDAAKIFNKLCQKPNAKACFSLAYMYEAGQGVARSEHEAQKYYARACKERLASACFNLALLYERNNNTNAANVALYKACDMHHIDACVRLGVIYEAWKEGDLAVKFYDKACKLQDAKACLSLGVLYDEGNFTRQNAKAAQSAYSNACIFGSGEACFMLGLQNETADKTRAQKYYGKACDLNFNDGCEAYKRLLKQN